MIVDLIIGGNKASPDLVNVFVVDMTFNHDNDDIIERMDTKFTAALEVIEFVNFLHDADQYLQENGSEPEDEDDSSYEMFQKWCDHSSPGLSTWPSDHNGNYFAELQDVTVTYYDHLGAPFHVSLIEGQ